MIYIVKYMYVYDDYKDAGASSSILGTFSDEAAAYKCAVQKYCEEIVEQLNSIDRISEECRVHSMSTRTCVK